MPRSRRTKPLHALAIPAALAVLTVGLTAQPASAAGCAGAGAHPSEVSLQRIHKATKCLVNQRRRAHGLRALRRSGDLAQAARRHSKAMVRRGFFSHVAPDGVDLVDRVRRTGYLAGPGSWSLGENIAYGGGRHATPRSIVQGWMRSPGHRANILSRDFRHVGVGVARGAPPGWERAATYTTDFGRN